MLSCIFNTRQLDVLHEAHKFVSKIHHPFIVTLHLLNFFMNFYLGESIILTIKSLSRRFNIGINGSKFRIVFAKTLAGFRKIPNIIIRHDNVINILFDDGNDNVGNHRRNTHFKKLLNMVFVFLISLNTLYAIYYHLSRVFIKNN